MRRGHALYGSNVDAFTAARLEGTPQAVSDVRFQCLTLLGLELTIFGPVLDAGATTELIGPSPERITNRCIRRTEVLVASIGHGGHVVVSYFGDAERPRQGNPIR